MNETVGEVKFNSKTQFDSFIKSLDKNESWMFLTRTNKELYELSSKLKKLGVKFYSVMNAPESEAQKQKIMVENKIKIIPKIIIKTFIYYFYGFNIFKQFKVRIYIFRNEFSFRYKLPVTFVNNFFLFLNFFLVKKY